MTAAAAGGKPAGRTFAGRLPFYTLWRAVTVRDPNELTKEEAASTLFRFFRSNHVADLKVIFYVVLFLVLFHIAVVVYSGARDTYLAAAIPIYSAIIAWAYVSASKRLGVVDLFACEISALCRVGTIFDVGMIYTEMYKSDAPARKHAAATHMSKEKYFSIFENNSSDLQSLEALVVGYITEYYTYMKATRDLLRKLATIDGSQIPKTPEIGTMPKVDLWHKTVADIIYVVFLGYESARKAIDDLIEFQPTRAEHAIMILMTELVCFGFLCEYLKADPVRFARLRLREDEYNAIIPALSENVARGYAGHHQADWTPAQRLLPELEARHKEAMDRLRHGLNP